MKTYFHIISFLLFTTFMASCSGKDQQPKAEEPVTADSIVKLTPDQIRNSGIESGAIEQRLMSGMIRVSGKIDIPPQNTVIVSAPLGGFIKSSEMLPGMKVRKGEVLAVLEHQDFIQLQQDYLKEKSKSEFLEKEYKRQQQLAADNVNSAKTLEQTKADYFSSLADLKGMEAKLQLIGINGNQLTADKISSVVTLRSPVDGYVSRVHVNMGTYVAPGGEIFRIVNTEHVHAELSVFEKDAQKLKEGQQVHFKVNGEDSARKAEVYLIGREIAEDRTVGVHCHLEKEDTRLLPGTYITAEIHTDSANAEALPNDAVVSYLGKNYVFIESAAGTYAMVPVNTGIQADGYTQVYLPQNISKQSRFVVKGAYVLLAALKNKEE
ncbi:MAG: efflux RND transporter periplasmic adaptor subunit [Bacteroidia bacterium]